MRTYKLIACLLIALQLTSCATTTLWKNTEPPPYIVISDKEVTENNLQEKSIKYIKNEQAGVYYIESTDKDKLKYYTLRALGTPITVAIDAAIVVLAAYALAHGGASGIGEGLPSAGSGNSDYWLSGHIARTNRIAEKNGGEKAVIDSLTTQFKANAELIQRLRGHGFTYGDIAAILALASEMTQGCTEDNIGIVSDLRDANIGWWGIAIMLNEVPSYSVKIQEQIHNMNCTASSAIEKSLICL